MLVSAQCHRHTGYRNKSTVKTGIFECRLYQRSYGDKRQETSAVRHKWASVEHCFRIIKCQFRAKDEPTHTDQSLPIPRTLTVSKIKKIH